MEYLILTFLIIIFVIALQLFSQLKKSKSNNNTSLLFEMNKQLRDDIEKMRTSVENASGTNRKEIQDKLDGIHKGMNEFQKHTNQSFQKQFKDTPSTETFVTSYYTFPDNFTTNLKGSKAFLQISVGVSTQYDETVMENVELHQLALRSEILGAVSEFAVEEIEGKTGRDDLSARIKDAINVKLEELEGFGGVEGVFFTSFVLQ